MNLNYTHLADRRLDRLSNACNVPRETAMGQLCCFWLRTQEAMLVEGHVGEIAAHMHNMQGCQVAQAQFLTALVECGYLQDIGGGKFRIVDNVEAIRVRTVRREASAKGVEARAVKRKAPPRARAAARPRKSVLTLTKEDQIANSYTWSAYAEAYNKRYHTVPTRNAKVNGLISQFVKRVGHADAPQIIQYYLTLNNGYYCKTWHPFDAALKDAETLRSQWLTKSAATNVEIRYRQQQADYEAEMRNIDLEESMRQQRQGDQDLYQDAVTT